MKKEQLTKKYKVHIRYELKDGTRVPGNTTIVGGWGENKGTLMNWGWKMGLEGIDIYAYMNEMKKIGTLAHALITNGLIGEDTDMSGYSQQQIDAAENSLLSWYEWEKNYKIKPILVEIPKVSEKYKFGTTIDIYAEINNVLEILELKSGSGIYESHFVQTSAQKQVLEENGYPVERVRILNIPRTEDESFLEEIVTKLPIWWNIFKSLLKTYYEHNEIKPHYKKYKKEKK